MDRREAFFGLIAPIGINLTDVVDELTQALKKVRYETNEIKMTDFLKEIGVYDLDYKTDIDRYTKFIEAGDQVCEDSGRKDILALYGIAKLAKDSPRDNPDALPQNVVHIFRQIKRVEEIDAFEEVFGRNILYIGCFSPVKNRISYLVRNMRKTGRGINKKNLEAKALEIISTDEEERDKPHGQRMLECYPRSDFILDCTSKGTLRASCERLVEIYFGAPFISPTIDEYCSYIANAASYRSLDLSRQVGAAIFNTDCEIISMGCNEVPKAGGGTYWSDAENDHRDYALGYDSNQRLREDMTRDALVRLQKQGWLAESFADLKPDELVNQVFAIDSDKKGPLFGSMIADVIEYGRMVHAEMNALADAARFRRSTTGATLYCTTMPCHMCTKLIIASGIGRVVFIQPYGKSLVDELFDDSVNLEGGKKPNFVNYDTLTGVTPNGFKRAFHKIARRKYADGTALNWDPPNSRPNFLSSYQYYQPLEVVARARLKAARETVLSKYAKDAPPPKIAANAAE